MRSEDITGGLDLLGDWLDAKGYTEEAGLCTRAMDEINRLYEWKDKAGDIDRVKTVELVDLRAENARLKEAQKKLEEQFHKVACEEADAQKEIARLRQAMHDIYEVYAGSEGFKPETYPEAYLQERILEMAYIAGKHKRVGGDDEN